MTNHSEGWFDTIPLPALVGIGGPDGRSYRAVRTLASDDQVGIDHAQTLYHSLKPIMTMFQIVNWNYDELQDFIKTLSKDEPHYPQPMLAANRLLLNYTASADALLEHFARQHKGQCRAMKQPDSGFKMLRGELEKTHDSFQFFACFRDHVLHRSLPVGHLSQTKSLTDGVRVSLTYSSDELRDSSPRDWAGCRLIKKMPTIDLVRVVAEFHSILNGQILKSVLACYHLALDKAAECHRRLTAEVVEAFPNHRPAILRERMQSVNEFTWQMDALPPDLLKDLGIRIGSPPAV